MNLFHLKCSQVFASLFLISSLPLIAIAAEPEKTQAGATFNVRMHGALGDGKTLDTRAINEAISACSKAGGGQVFFPAGRYLSGTIRLQSHVTLHLDAGARIIGTADLTQYEQPGVPDFMPEAKWGKWHRALLLGENVEDVTISGSGMIDGNKVFDPTGEEKRRGPHTLVFVNCRRFTIRDVTFQDSANYAIFFQVSDEVEVRDVKFVGGWDGVHFRGAPDRPCKQVRLIGCHFYTGDDAIAGRYWDGTVISDCIVNSSCNGIRLIGPAKHLVVKDCLFLGPGEQPHITSGRTNMLAGIILQPGAWDATRGTLDDVLLADNTMHNVASPVTIWTKPGNQAGRITVSGLRATGVYRAALSVEGWGEEPIQHVVFRDVKVEFTGGGKAEQAQEQVRGPGVDPRPLPAWALYARNVARITMEDVRFSLAEDDSRPVILVDKVTQLTLDNVRYPKVEAVSKPLVLQGESQVKFDFSATLQGNP